MNGELINCWEFKQCGRELNGKNVLFNGLCPAAIDPRLNGVHLGRNAGRCCWVVRSLSDKHDCIGNCSCDDECNECNFYKLVTETTEEIIITV